MCGICGAVGFEQGEALVERMNATMCQRGPDSAGYVHQPQFNLGVRRLRIIDLQTGDQPLYNEDGTIAVVQNGEIYNYRELRHQLAAAGHKFASQSDSEVIVHAYEQWGPDLFTHLEGMFALVVLDYRQPGDARLLLGRDRLGIKPLYIWQDSHSLLFASEVRALLASEQIQRSVSEAGLLSYLAFGSLQEPLTIIENITSLAPASWMSVRWDERGIRVSQERYWEPENDQTPTVQPGEVRAWLEEAVTRHLVSDVPLGAFLSGGLDSGALVSLGSQALVRQGSEGMQAFTLGFNDWDSDERSLAQASAEFAGARQQVRLIRAEDFLEDLPQALAAMDLPTADGVNSWFVAREARRAGLTVALSGVGGDELFAGYPSFRQVGRLTHLKKLPVASWITGLGARWSLQRADRQRKLQAFLEGDPLYPHAWFAIRGLFTSSQIMKLLRQETWEKAIDAPRYQLWREAIAEDLARANRFDAIGAISWLELSQYMRSTLLRDTDMMSMAHSLEVRVPFLDDKLVERVLPLPGSFKLADQRSKPLLADALKADLPGVILGSPKRTFTFPFEAWLQSGLREAVGARLKSPHYLGEWFEPDSVAQAWDDFISGRLGWARPWSIYVLDQWMEKNLT